MWILESSGDKVEVVELDFWKSVKSGTTMQRNLQALKESQTSPKPGI
jgi:hypothetical protein